MGHYGNFDYVMDEIALSYEFDYNKRMRSQSPAHGSPSLDLILHDELQSLLDQLEAVFQVRAGFFSPNGEVLRLGRSRNAPYCEIIQTEVFGMGPCHASDVRKQGECMDSMKPLCYQCHAGLQEAVIPVMIDECVAGFMMIGQLRALKAIPEKVLNACGESGVRVRLERAFKIIPYITEGKFEAISGLFGMLVEYAVSKEIVALRGDWIWEKVNRYLDANLKRKVCLHDLSRITGRSASTVSHALKGKSGKTFKRILKDKRLDRADALMIERPDLGIGEIAREVGYEDSLYFSRVYHKRRGSSPSKARSSKSKNATD